MNRKRVLIDGNMMHQKALSLSKNFSKGSPKTSDTKPFTVSKGWLQIQEYILHFIISHHHKKKGKYSTTRYFDRVHSHITFSTVCYNCILLAVVVNLLLCLIDTLYHQCVCIGKNIVYKGFRHYTQF